jgi:hypothetical protein
MILSMIKHSLHCKIRISVRNEELHRNCRAYVDLASTNDLTVSISFCIPHSLLSLAAYTVMMIINSQM